MEPTMPNPPMLRWLPMLLAASMSLLAQAANGAGLPSHFTAPAQLEIEGAAPLPYENGFLLVPENRAEPDARRIAVRYLRFPAQTPAPAQAPVVMLPGGPGSVIAEDALRRS